MTSIILSAFAAFSPLPARSPRPACSRLPFADLPAFSLVPFLRGSSPARALADPSVASGPMRFTGIAAAAVGALGTGDVGAGEMLAVPAGRLGAVVTAALAGTVSAG